MDRTAQNTETGEVFIETGLEEWKERLEAWKKNHSKFCPMPRGHLMFCQKRYGPYERIDTYSETTNRTGTVNCFEAA